MTKEELKQEAEEKYYSYKMADFQGFYNRHYYYLGYLDSAEPREKRIAELERENAELDCQMNRNKHCYSCANAAERCFRNEIGCPCEKYKSYKDENAELRERISYLEDNLRVARKDREHLQLKVGKGLKEFIKDCPHSALKLYASGYHAEQVEKAKEILEKLLEEEKNNMYWKMNGSDKSLYYEVRKQAEQFLSEVEK